MASKKLRDQDSDLDSSLDFEDFDFSTEDTGSDRNPRTKAVKSTVRGVKKGLADTELIKTILRKNLPKEYGDAFDQFSELQRGVRDYSEQLVKDAKPAIGNIANAVDKWLPNNFQATKRQAQKILEWAEKDDSSSASMSNEERQRGEMDIEIARVFEKQNAIAVQTAKLEKQERAIDRGLEIAQHRDVLSILYKIASATGQQAQYTTAVTSAWQKKSLETQYRSLFIQQDMLEETKRHNAEMIAHLASITKNTALPEYRKTQQDEAFLEEARRKFSSKIVDASHDFMKRGLMKMKEDISGAVGDLTNITSMLSLAADMQAMEDEFDPQTLTDRFSEMGGKKVGQWALSKGGDKLFKMIKKNPKAVEAILRGQQFLRSFQQDGAGIATEMFDKGRDKGGILGFLSSYLGDTFTLKEQSTALAGHDFRNLHNAAPFTNRMGMSLTDVIPGLLSRILQSNERMRTGKDVDLVKFDWRSGKFSTSGKIVESIKKSISAEELSRNNDYYLNDLMATIESKVDLTPAERDDIARALLKKGVDGSALNPSKMTDSHHWAESLKEYSTAEKMAQAMRDIYGTDSDKEFYGVGMKAQQKAAANDFIKQVKNLKNLRKDLYAQAQFLMDNDMLDEAQKADLIDKFENINIDLIDRNSTRSTGSYKGKGSPTKDINQEYAGSKNDLDGHDKGIVQKGADLLKKGFKKATGGFHADANGYLVDDEGKHKLDSDGNPIIVGTSDIHAKRDITPAGSSSSRAMVLHQMARMPIYNWRYKKGRGDGGATMNMGPMAQDMRRHFGEEAAPGGTTIDLVNANGITMKAIQELNEKVDGFTGGGDGGSGGGGGGNAGSGLGPNRPSTPFDALLGIYTNTLDLVEQGRSMININTEGIKAMMSGLGASFGDMDLSGLGAEAKARFEAGFKSMKHGSNSLLGKLGDFISYMTGETISGGIRRGKQLGGALWSGAKAVGGFVSDVSGKAKVKALETFDVYVDGEEEPRMVAIKMKQDMYWDPKAKQVIKTRQQIRNAVNGVMEIVDGKKHYVLRKSEMASVYFVNTYKNAVERLVTGAAGYLKTGAKSVLDNIVAPGFKAGLEIGKKAHSFAMNLMDQPFDIFVAGKPEQPAIVAKKMRDGDYIDFASGEPITRPSQITGAVWDVAKKEMALTVDDIREGLVDIYGKKVQSSALMRFGKMALGTAAGAAFEVGKWGLDKLSKAPGILGKLTRKGTDMLSGLASKLGLPSIGFGNKETNSILRDIREILRYQAGLTGDIKDLGNVVGGGKIADGVKAAIKEATEGPKEDNESSESQPGFFSRMGSKFSNWFKGRKGKGVHAANIASGGALVPTQRKYDDIIDLNGRPQTYSAGNEPGGGFGLLGNAASKLLGWGGRKALGSSIAQKYLPSPVSGALNALVAKPGEEGAPQNNGMPPSAATLLLGNAMKKQRRDTSGAQDVNYRDIPQRKGSWQEREANARNINKEIEREKAMVKVYETKNIFSMIGKAMGSIKDKIFGKTDETNDLLKDIRNILAGDAVGDALGGGGGGGGDGKGKKGKGGKARKAGRFGKLGRLGSLGMKGLGIAGTAYGGYSAYQNVKEGNYGEAALDAGMAAAGLGVTLAGVGATASWIGGAAATIAGGAATLLASPVVLAGLAGAAVGYLGYKGYQWLTRKKFNYTEIMRMLEYGLRGGDEDQMRKIYELELYMDSVSKITDQQLDIDSKKFKVEEVMSIFDVSKKDQPRVDDLMRWVELRFKPIYAKWRAMVRAVSGQDKLEWIEKAKGDKLLDLYKMFKITDSAYAVSASPFKNMKMNTNTSIITSFKDEWLMSLKKEAVDKKDEQLGRDVAATGKALLEARAQGKEPDFANVGMKTGADALALTAETNAAGAKVMVASEYNAGYVSNSVNALEAIRYKSYGLVVMKASVISALRNLEAITMDFMKIDSSGKATFDGDVKEIIKKAGGYFGVTASDGEFTAKWTNWYMNRFLPVYLAMHSAIFAITQRADLRNNVRALERFKPSESLVVARAMMGAKGIWEIKDFAFKGQVAGTNATVCDENILFIENMAAEESIKEEKASKNTVAPPTPADAIKPTSNPVAETKATEPPKQQSQQVGPKTVAQSAGLSDEPEQKAFTDDAPGQKEMIKANATPAPGAMPTAAGELFSGAGGLAFLTLANGANIEGLHPSVKRLFLGMAEEYGKLTGKKLQVNTAYRSFKEQEALFKKYGPGRAARPGSSLHEYGLALDVQSADLEQLEKLGLLRKYGFTRPLGSEPWHIEPAGIHDNAVRQKAKTDHGYATQFIESGIGRGGGGLGSRGRSGELRRDDNYAKQIFEAASQATKTQGEDAGKAPPPPSAGQQMTSAATTGASSPLNGGGLATGMPDVETKEGRVSYNQTAANSSSFDASRIGENTAAAVKELEQTSYDITTGTGGTGTYASLPGAEGKGWSGTGLLIKEAAKAVGVDPGLAAAIAAKESSLNPAAQGKNSSAGNSVAQGLYQFMPGTWKDVMRKYGKKFGIPENASPLDPKANALLGMSYFKASGDGTTIGSYLGHMLGPGGWRTIQGLKDSDFPARALSAAASNNPNIFFHGGDKSRPRNKVEFMEFIGTQINKQLTDFKIPLKIDTKAGASSPGVASNDAAGFDSPPSGISRVSDTGGGERVSTGYKPAEPSRPVNVPAQSQPSGLSTISESQPVASVTKTAPVQENTNNGIARLEKISNTQVTELQKANNTLEQIRDLIGQIVDERFTRNSNEQKKPEKSATDQAVEASKSQPAPLPQSYVQRRRVA